MEHLQAKQELFKIIRHIELLNLLKLETMKSILYVGATLMIGASIYGFVDYQKTSRNKAFTNMYGEKKTQDPVVINDNGIPGPVKKEITANEKTDPLFAVVNTSSSNTNITEQPVKKIKNRKFSTRLFSRGAFDEKYIDKMVKPKDLKTEEKKPEIKEQ